MKKYFITGLAILLPVVLTVMIIVFLFNLLTTPFVHGVNHLFLLIQKHFSFSLSQGLALFVSRVFIILFLVTFIFLLGVVARWFLIKHILAWTNHLFSKIPIIKSVYHIIREVISALFSLDGKKAFHHPVLLPFPKDPLFSIGFHTGRVAEECQKAVGVPLAPVFVPTAPHPISGFLFLVPENEAKKIDMTNEEAIKFLVSCGLVYQTSSSEGDGKNELF
jgi:uncharacterized membrane protein